eukprot:553662-Pyramimonas_sp.AAC.1
MSWNARGLVRERAGARDGQGRGGAGSILAQGVTPAALPTSIGLGLDLGLVSHARLLAYHVDIGNNLGYLVTFRIWNVASSIYVSG